MTAAEEPTRYYPLEEVVNSSNLSETFSYFVGLENPVDYIPILNVIHKNKASPMFNAKNYNDFSLFDGIRGENFTRFLLILQTYSEDLYFELLKYAIKNAILHMTYYLCSATEYPNIERAGGEKEIKILLCDDEKDWMREQIIDLLFNLKIRRIGLLMRPGGDVEFQRQRDRLRYFIRNILKEKDYFSSINLITLTHIIVFEMYYESDNETLRALLQYKCKTGKHVKKADRVRNMDKLEEDFVTNTNIIYDFYTSILGLDIDAIKTFAQDVKEGTYSYIYDQTKDFLPLFLAIQREYLHNIQTENYENNVTYLLLNRLYCNPNITDYQKSNAFHWAAKNESLFQYVQAVNQMDINTVYEPDILSRSPIFEAMKYDYSDYVLDCCYSYEKEIHTDIGDFCDIFGNSIIMMAIKYDCYDLFKQISTRKMHLYNLKTLNLIDYCSRYIVAVDTRQTEIIDSLLFTDDDINLASYYGITPLTVAITKCDYDLIWKLLVYGATIDVKIVNNIYFRHKDQLPYAKDNLVETREIFKTKSYYDDLFTFTYNFFTKNGTQPLINERRPVLKILIEQYVFSEKELEFDNIMDESGHFKRSCMVYFKKCKQGWKVIRNILLFTRKQKSITLEDFLTESPNEIYDTLRIYNVTVKKFKQFFKRLKNNILYNRLIDWKYRYIVMRFYRTEAIIPPIKWRKPLRKFPELDSIFETADDDQFLHF